jgi:hypothetical protein
MATVREMKAELKALGLDPNGKKDVLLARLEEAKNAHIKASSPNEQEVADVLRAKREYKAKQAEDFNRKFRR